MLLGNKITTLNNDNIVTPKSKLQVPNFIKGYIDSVDINMLPQNAIYTGENIRFDMKGSIETRPGVDKLLSTILGAYRVRSVGTFDEDDEVSKLLVAYDSNVGYIDTVTNTVSNIITDLSNLTNKVRMLTRNNILYVANGADPMHVWDGTTLWEATMAAPDSAPVTAIRISAPKDTCTATAGDSTGLTGAYKYQITYVTASGESGPSPDSTVLTISNKDIDLTNIPIGPTGTTQRKIYRTKAYAITYYLLTTIADNTTTTYTDTTADASLGTTEPPDPLSLNGKYLYRYTFVYGARGESQPSACSTELDIVNGSVSVSGIDVGGSGVTKRKLYRTIANGVDETQRLLTTIDDNTTTTYTDNSIDGDLKSEINMTNTSMTGFDIITLKKKTGVIWAAKTSTDPTTVYFSDSVYPEQFPADNYVTLTSPGDKITAIIEFDIYMLVFTKTKIFKISGDTIDTVSVSIVSHTVGCISAETLQHVRQDLYFLAYGGVYTLNKVLISSNESSIDVRPLTEDVNKTFTNMQWEYAEKACSFVYDNCYGIAIPYTLGSTENDLVMVYHLDNKNWTRWTSKLGYMASCVVMDIDGKGTNKLYVGTSTQNGQVYIYPGNSYSDDGSAFNSDFITTVFGEESSESMKRWKSLYLEVEATGDWDLNVWSRLKPYTDIEYGWSHKTVSLDPSFTSETALRPVFYEPVALLYPVIQFASSSSPATILIKVVGLNLSGQSKFIQFKFGNDGAYNEYFKIFKLTMFYRVKNPKIQST